MFVTPWLAAWLLVLSIGADRAVASESGFVGSKACAACHNSEHQNWLGSQHDLAMQLPTDTSVLGDFNNAAFDYNGITTHFFRKDGGYFVRTDGEDGKLADFPVDYVFGVYPLQQYLLPLSRGRWQALSIAWDARPASEGGQRWYHLYPDEKIDFKTRYTGPAPTRTGIPAAPNVTAPSWRKTTTR